MLLQETDLPESFERLQDLASEACGVPATLVKMVCDGEPLMSLEGVPKADELVEVMVLVDETPMYTWDIDQNPDNQYLQAVPGLASGANVMFKNISKDAWADPDYVNVLTQVPVHKGVHFVEFLLHSVQDEQWCGVTMSQERAGSRGGEVHGCFYYAGRRRADVGYLDAPRERRHVMSFSHVASGDRIGLLLDADEGVALFCWNGEFQGGCRVPTCPMYFCTALDRGDDAVELVRRPVEDFPVKLEDVVGTGKFLDDNLFAQAREDGVAGDLSDFELLQA